MAFRIEGEGHAHHAKRRRQHICQEFRDNQQVELALESSWHLLPAAKDSANGFKPGTCGHTRPPRVNRLRYGVPIEGLEQTPV